MKPGRYYIGIYNPNDVSQIAQLFVQILPPGGGNANTVDFTAAGASNLLDDAVSYSSITLTNQQKITALNIGVALQHPRISDLVLTLISPTGQRFLLMENRGGNTANAGSTTPATNITQWANSEFETSPAGDYPGGATIEGWTVTSNQVSVVNDPTNANAGSHFLALANGTISRTFSTTPGNKYTLRYAYRGPGIASWWRFEGNVNDAVGGNTGTPVGGPGFIAGEVGQAMSLNGSNAYVSVPAAASLNVGAGPGMTIDAWIKPSDLAQRTFVEWYSGVIQTYFWMSVPTLGGGPGSLFANFVDTTGRSHQISSLPNLLNTNSWQHVACTYDRIGGGIARLYLNGFQVAQANLGIFTPNTSATFYMGYRPPGAGAPYSGGMDELSIYSRTLSASELRAIAAAGSGGKFDPAASAPQNLAEVLVTLNGVQTNSFGSNRNWQTNVITFTAAGTTGTAAIIGLEPGMLIDSITLTEESAQPQYLTFTENTNLAHVPIKYATAPFLNSATGSVQTVSDFEAAPPADYPASDTSTGWKVDTNQVSVINDPPNAQIGNQFLALAKGSISRTLATVPGDKYKLTFGYRGPGIVSWWRGENGTGDAVGNNNGAPIGTVAYVPGIGGQAFKFNGASYINCTA